MATDTYLILASSMMNHLELIYKSVVIHYVIYRPIAVIQFVNGMALHTNDIYTCVSQELCSTHVNELYNPISIKR